MHKPYTFDLEVAVLIFAIVISFGLLGMVVSEMNPRVEKEGRTLKGYLDQHL